MGDESLKFKDKVIIGCMLFSGFAFFLPDSINFVALYVAIPVAFLLSFLGDNGRYDNHTFKTSLFLFAWLLISTLWAKYPDLAMAQNKQLLGVVLVSYIVGKNAYNKKMRPWMYGVWIAIFLSAVYHAKTHIIPNIEVGQVRLNDAKLNANMMGYYTFYLTFAIFILGEEIQQSILIRRIFRLLFLGMIFVSYFVAIITASRQVLIIQIPLLTFLLYLRYIKEVSYTYRFLFFTLVAVVIFFSSDIVVDSYNNSLLQKRNQQEVKDDTRTLLVKDAFRVGMDHFYIGVGNGNYVKYSVTHNFSHNSYLELFANTGIIGLSIYLYM